MLKRRLAKSLAMLALVAAAAGYFRAPLAQNVHVRLPDITTRSAAKELPRGFVLPSSDVDLGVSSLVAADLDADGDLDIVAADNSGGSPGIVVWVNDGDGRLTRKSPAPPKTLGSEPTSPSVEQHQSTVVVSIQPNVPAVETIGPNAWFTLPARTRDLPPSSAASSASLARLRSRSPPVLS